MRSNYHTLILVAVASAACTPGLKITYEGCSNTCSAQTLAGANVSPSFDSMPLFDTAQYVETDAISGPILLYLPESIILPRRDVSGTEKWRGFLFIANTGHLDLIRSGVSITGSDSAKFRLVSRHAATMILPRGEFEDFQIEYLPRRCNSLFNPLAVDEAALRIASNAGVVVVPLVGNRWGCSKHHEDTEVKSK